VRIGVRGLLIFWSPWLRTGSKITCPNRVNNPKGNGLAEQLDFKRQFNTIDPPRFEVCFFDK